MTVCTLGNQRPDGRAALARNLALPDLSSLGPVPAVKLARNHLRWLVDLQGLRYSHQVLLAALGAISNGLPPPPAVRKSK